MKLSVRLGVAFGALIGIALLLGGMAVWNMKSTTRGAAAMSKEKVPEVAVANEVERASLLTMYDIRGYGFTEQTNFLNADMTSLA